MLFPALKDPLLKTMLEAARLAGRELNRRRTSAVKTKMSMRDFVINMDYASDEVLRKILEERFPRIPYASEESGEPKPGTSGWCVDALDGTVNCFHGDVFWGVSIALLRDGIPEAGVVCLPALKMLFCASHSEPAWQVSWNLENRRRIHVGTYADLKSSSVWTDHNKLDPPLTRKVFGVLDKISLLPQIRVCCTASMMWLATGRIAGYIHPGPTPSDTAASILIVRKAGGIVTDKHRMPATPFSQPVIAATPMTYGELETKLRHLFF